MESEEEVKSETKSEGAKNTSSLASFAQRALAMILDLLIIYFVFFIIDILILKLTSYQNIFSIISSRVGHTNRYINLASTTFLLTIFLFIPYTLIAAYLESKKAKASIGKSILGLTVVDERLKQLTFSKSLIRSLSKFLSLSVFGLGFLLFFINKKKQALHDILAKSVVLSVKKKDVNTISLYSILVLILSLTAFVSVGFLLPKPKPVQRELYEPKRAVEKILPVKGYIQKVDNLIKVKDSFSIYDPLREQIELYVSSSEIKIEQKDELLNKYEKNPPNFSEFKAVIKLQANSLKCSKESVGKITYHVLGKKIKVKNSSAELKKFRCELLKDSHLTAGFFKKRIKQIAWDLDISSPLQIRREKALISYSNSEIKSSIALYDKAKSKVEIGKYSTELLEEEIMGIRKSKNLINDKLDLILTFELIEGSGNLNLATIKKYGLSFIKSDRISFPGESDRIDFYYIPQVGETKQLEGVSGYLSEGEILKGRLMHNAKKVISKIDFDVSWDIDFDLSVFDVDSDLSSLNQQIAAKAQANINNCQISAGDSKFNSNNTVALYYPSEGDVAVGVFDLEITEREREIFRKKKSIWSSVDGKIANFVLFFNLKRDSKSFSKNLLLDYKASFIRHRLMPFYFEGAKSKVSFIERDVDFTEEEIKSLSGSLEDGSIIKFDLNKSRVGNESNIKFSWDCNLEAKLLKLN